ncbi:MAG: NAD(P)H-dependent oxidoreductase [Prolixibacteraceae bacterium]|nr:NAD(P)H-dependent oxidoreductase [Prolixibacteraceae bacterium]
MEIVKNLEWRYATKKFDRSKKVNASDLEKIKEAVKLSASSYGLQAYKVLVIENAEIRQQLRSVSWDQAQITDSSLLFVFCNYTHVNGPVIDDYMQLIANTKGVRVDELSAYAEMIRGSVARRTSEQVQNWTSKQTYIALANLLSATAELKIDACPMEGFDAAKYDEILGLKEKGLTTSVIAAVGYRSADDAAQYAPKVRKPVDLLFEKI